MTTLQNLADVYGPDGAAAYHDLTVQDTNEIREICRAVRMTEGPVLELAAGSGRLTLPLLALRRRVTALDLSDDLLRLLGERLREAPEHIRTACVLVHGDMSGFRLEQRFGAIVLGTTSISLLDGDARKGLYQAAAEHLAPAGRFLVTTRSATGHEDTTVRVEGASGRGYLLTETWTGAYVRQVAIRPDGSDRVLVSHVHDVTADRLAHELAEGGFRVLGQSVIGAGPGWENTLVEAEVAVR
ncbi:daptide-type RiPP biosynthesis methyltransferase [Streptomyces sp. DSM 41972]|uniref:Daptide-type RiPP biosynthesis methyltransferase n=1 Tax=Streptomyces althioticus subsp. attaecolombicae TaxID=3075534 RepID=A0ABU3I3W9_9ACTN|nr:daptide-type RiPP biosynthesis methyltransferase [Streptomyces sp. DSM 41972]SCD31228.1 Methyltransferase domain-containing protein [Streptomyces sp. di50b]SCE29393.1 Methyltransferase domain-containing protein [Streptomyces sp. di188]